MEVSDERHLDDRHDASNVTFASVGVEHTSPSDENSTPPTSPRTSPSRPPGTIGRPRSPNDSAPPQIRITVGAFRGPWLRLRPPGGRQQATAGMTPCSGSPTPPAAVEHDCKRGPAAGVGVPNTQAPARCRLSGHSGRLWRSAGLTNPTVEPRRARVESAHTWTDCVCRIGFTHEAAPRRASSPPWPPSMHVTLASSARPVRGISTHLHQI